MAAGDVLVFDATHDQAFATTTTPADARVLGVAAESIGVGAQGKVNSLAGSVCTINCDTGAVSRGDWLVSSATTKLAASAGSYKPPAGFTFASATWATVGGAALPANRYTCGAVSNTTANGWTVGGDSGGGLQTTAYNLSYSTETYSTVGTAALSVARQFIPYGSHSSLSGYMCGGANAGGQTNIFKLLYSSSVTSTLGAVISSGRWSGAAVSDGTYSYIEGGTTGSDVVTADKLNMTNDTCAANAGSNLTVAKSGTMSMTYPAIAGYIAQQSFTNKVTFASSIASNVGGVISTVIQYAAGISDGNGLGYVSGGNGAINVTNSFTRATETFATAVPSNLITGKSQAAVFNNGAF